MSAKTELPTPKRLWEARRRGQVAKSDSLASAAIVLALALSLPILGPGLIEILRAAFHRHLELAIEAPPLSVDSAFSLVAEAGRTGLAAVAPIFTVIFLAAVGALFLQIGPIFSTHPLSPTASRLSPAQNLRSRLTSQGAVFAFWRSFLELAIVSLALYWVAKTSLREIGSAVREPAAFTAALTAHLLTRLAIVTGGALLCLGGIDLLLRWRQHLHSLRMSKEEIAQEQRQAEADPRYRGARQRLHQEILSTYSPGASSPGAPPERRADAAATSRNSSWAGGKPGAQ